MSATASQPRHRAARPHRLRVRADRRAPGPRAGRGRARDVLADVVRALRLQAFAQAAAQAADRRARTCCMGPGENAGAVDVGGGLAVAFKVESHNHPSAVEPFQGAATGVGGILRDVFAVGARPIAVLDSLRFGEPGSLRALALPARARRRGHRPLRQLDRSADGRRRDLLRAGLRAELPDQRDVPGACSPRAADPLRRRRRRATCSCCSARSPAATGSAARRCSRAPSWARRDEAKRPSVQIGDPFAEKKLMECCLELLDRELLVSLQDLGAAGLTSSASEMASKGEVGLDIDVSRVPLREPGHGAVRDHDLRIPGADAVRGRAAPRSPTSSRSVSAGRRSRRAIGEVTAGDRLRVLDGERVVGELPVRVLVDDCPLYDLEPAPPPTPTRSPPPPPGAPPAPAATGAGESAAPEQALADTLLELLGSANIASRRPVFEQYDPVVQSRTVRRPDEADAAVLALPDGSAIAVSIDGNGRRVACDPRAGAAEAVFRVRGEPCLRRRGTPRAHQLPELREPGEAARRLAADRGGRGHRAGVRGARGAGRRRQRLALQRGAVGRDLPDAGGRDRRASSPTRARAGRLGFVREGDAIALVGAVRARPRPGRSWRSFGAEPPAGPLPPKDVQAVRDAHAAGSGRYPLRGAAYCT